MIANDIVDGQAQVSLGIGFQVGTDVEVFQQLQHGRTLVPRSVLRRIDNVVADQSRHWNNEGVLQTQALC